MKEEKLYQTTVGKFIVNDQQKLNMLYTVQCILMYNVANLVVHYSTWCNTCLDFKR